MYKEEYERWLKNATLLESELKAMDENEISDAFYRDLEFGTGGLRGVIGAGTNRMNIYTVAKASTGLANYILNNFPDNKKIAISFDSRIKSDEFSKVAAEIFSKKGIEVYIYPELMPTPCLSFAVRYYGCAAGAMITASHNPSKYNGYKVYGPDGCQITTYAAETILKEIEKIDIFNDIEWGKDENKIHTIGADCYDAFIEAVKNASVLYGDEVNRDVTIVYTPLNGTGLKPVTRALKESGFTNIFVVPEQENPDGNFPTCPYPNPEIREALELGLKYADEKNADLLIATDPDADRVGIAVRNNGEMKLLTGNEVGILLFDFIAGQRIKYGRMPERPVLCKTIVTTDMADKIAKSYNVETINVLTGFKFIGEQILFLEEKGEENRYIFGFEESYGYLSAPHARDKDAVNAALIICEMYAYYRDKGISLVDKLEELYKKHGYALNTLHSYEFPGESGFNTMKSIMADFRNEISEFAGLKVKETQDYKDGYNGLPKSDVVKFILEGGSSVVIRPSGTEPKLKAYISVMAENEDKARDIEADLTRDIEKIIKK